MIKESPWTFQLSVRTMIVLLIGLLLNGLFFWFAYIMKLPLILFESGSLYAAIVLGPIGGILVTLITGIVLAVVIYSPSMLLFSIVTLTVVITAGLCVKSGFVSTWLSALGLIFVILMLNILLNVAVAMLFFGGQPFDYYSAMLFDILALAGFSTIAASTMTVLVVQTLDTVVCCMVAGAAYLFTPKEKKKKYFSY